MNEEKKTVFAEGMYFDRPREGAPSFVKGRMSIKVDKAIPFLKESANDKGYVNLTLMLSKDGQKLYLQLDTWKPKENEVVKSSPKVPVDEPIKYPKEEIDPADIPF